MAAALSILSVGMVTAVGLSAPASCAAMRAGLDGFQETRFTDSEGEWVIGAPVPLPRPWTGEKRLAHLAAAAACEALDAAPRARAGAVLLLCVPEEGRFGSPVRDPSRLARRIAEIADLEAHPLSRVVAHGRPSGHVALEHARRLIAAGSAPQVLIVGVDSYLTPNTIALYAGRRRLLTPDNPDGFIPGEGAAAVLLGPPARGGIALHGLGLSRDPAPIDDVHDVPFRGDGMTSAYRTALAEAGVDMRQLGYRISDLIGEAYYFKQATLATARLLRGRHEFQDLWSPAESLGNVGAAVVPLMLGMAFTAAAKGYAAGDPVLIEASNDAGACGAALFSVAAA